MSDDNWAHELSELMMSEHKELGHDKALDKLKGT